MEMYDQIESATSYINSKTGKSPQIGLILGSGLGVLAEQINQPIILPYTQIPGFPVSTVEGHAGQLVLGELCGKTVVAMQGRFHYYEGYSMDKITFPVRVMKLLGVKTLIVTNAAGSVNETFKPGDLMIITDHINMMGMNPLIGANDERFGPRFPDMTEAYSKELREVANQVAKKQGLDVKEGIYVGNTGPTYETPAEVRMARVLGGDAVGMSTVPEVIVARHCGLKVLGISCLTNMAAGIVDQPLSHAEVIETTEKVQKSFLCFVKEIVTEL